MAGIGLIASIHVSSWDRFAAVWGGADLDLDLSRFTRLMGKFYELLVVDTSSIISE